MIRLELQNFEKLQRSLGAGITTRALNIALQRTAMKARTQVSKMVREVYNVKARDISKRVRIRKVRVAGKVSARELNYAGERLGIDVFGMKETKVSTPRGIRRGITAMIRKDRGRRRIPGAFAADVHGLKGFFRKGPDRLPIDRIRTVSVPQMVVKIANLGRIQEQINETTGVEFNRAMTHLINREVRR